MQRSIFHAGALPEFHSNLLVARVQPVGLLADRSAAIATGAPLSVAKDLDVTETPGLKALDALERSGRIRGVTPLAGRGNKDALPLGLSRGLGVTRAMILNSAGKSRDDKPSRFISRGVHFIELESENDADTLRSELSQDPNVESVSRVPMRYLQFPPEERGLSPAAVPPTVPPGAHWNLRRIQWSEARALGSHVEPTEIRVAVLDTGIDSEHPDLVGRIDRYVYEYPDIAVATSDRDIVGHGTHVAAIAGATFNNNIGIAGICHCRLQAWKIFSDEPRYLRNQFGYVVHPVMYERALLDCLDENVEVVNLSIGGPGLPTPEERETFNALIAQGTAIVAAMGNERVFGSPISYPAAIPDVIAVGATRPDDRVARFSNRGPHIWLSAPGVAIWSALPRYTGQTGFDANLSLGVPVQGKPHYRETDYDAWDGTSMAAPHVAGAVAMLLASKGRLPLGDIRRRLREESDRVPEMAHHVHHQDYGYGRLNLRKLLS